MIGDTNIYSPISLSQNDLAAKVLPALSAGLLP